MKEGANLHLHLRTIPRNYMGTDLKEMVPSIPYHIPNAACYGREYVLWTPI